MRLVRCGFIGCGKYIEHSPATGKWYCSNKCRQAAYRQRKAQGLKAVPKTFDLRCVNCGNPFVSTRETQRFDSNSCRVSFHQQQKRLNNSESIEA